MVLRRVWLVKYHGDLWLVCKRRPIGLHAVYRHCVRQSVPLLRPPNYDRDRRWMAFYPCE